MGEDNGVTAEISDLEQKLIRQIEYYFGDYNLIKDNFLQQTIKDNNGWVKLETLVTFKRLKELSTDFNVITNALKKSPTQLLEVSENGTEIRRSLTKPLPDNDEKRKEDINSRSVYVKGIPLETTLDELLEYFKKQGPVEHVQMRYFQKLFKGSLFVVFGSKEEQEAYLEKGEKKYGDIDLLRESKTGYLIRKREERMKSKAEKGNSKRERIKSAVAKVDETPTYEKGYILHVSGLPTETKMEEIKAVFNKDDVAWVDYNKGDVQSWIRFKEGTTAEKHVERVKEANDGKIVINGAELTYRILEGDEELEHYKKVVKTKEQCKQMRHKGGRGKGRGHFGRGGGRGQFKNRRGNRDTENGGEQHESVKAKNNSKGETSAEASEKPASVKRPAEGTEDENAPKMIKT